jgi:parallel beta-helix repeat protein
MWNGYVFYGSGIVVSSTSYSIISGNYVAYNLGDGICLAGDSNYNTISKNVIERNVHTDDFDWAGRKYYGIWLSPSSKNNIIHHNDLIKNKMRLQKRNAYDKGTNNIWFNSTINEGNYWDDYTGSDNNGDGIGDTPYNIPLNSKDDYPLVNPTNQCNILVSIQFNLNNHNQMLNSQQLNKNNMNVLLLSSGRIN